MFDLCTKLAFIDLVCGRGDKVPLALHWNDDVISFGQYKKKIYLRAITKK